MSEKIKTMIKFENQFQQLIESISHGNEYTNTTGRERS